LVPAACVRFSRWISEADQIGAEERRRGAAGGGSSAAASSSRYVTTGSDPSTNPYETQQSVHEYLLMHFGGERELLNFPALQGEQLKNATGFPKQCAEVCARHLHSVSHLAALPASQLRALDIGCAVGRSSFELARWFGTVVGLDYSQAFIDAANALKREGKAAYRMRVEGDIEQEAVAEVDPSLERSRVRFVQGDACDLALDRLGGQRFHVLLAANLLCRLPYPRRFLAALPGLIEPEGFVVLPSPYTWLEQYTPKSEWIGATVDPVTGEPRRSFDVLRSLMEGDGGHFRLVEATDMPFFIRETARKNQWSVAHCTVWQRTLTPA
jgi:putative 4-mercaptohistidine N1-methyltranferase